MRIAAIVEYDGSRFSGWQRQAQARSVQQCVEEALAKVADQPIEIIVAGRTDAGVHAAGQVIHFDTHAERSAHSWVRGAVAHLPAEIALLWAGPVAAEFHARFSATGRHYHYVILNRPIRPTYLARRVTHEYRPLDVERMQQAAQYLVGTHDFTSFRSNACEAKSPVRELRALHVARDGALVHVRAYANAFLHHMVRNLVGVLAEVGAGERPPEWARQVLQAHDRTQAGPTAPPDGLYLTAVEYPAAFGIPAAGQVPVFWRMP
jgi:tRNA pseudouridine38-40 synthase